MQRDIERPFKFGKFLVVEAAELFLTHGWLRISKLFLATELRLHIKILNYEEKFRSFWCLAWKSGISVAACGSGCMKKVTSRANQKIAKKMKTGAVRVSIMHDSFS